MRGRDNGIATLVKKHNNIIKVIRNNSNYIHYIWCRETKLYLVNDKKDRKMRIAIITILKKIIKLLSRCAKVSEGELNKMLDKYSRASSIRKITNLLLIKPEEKFEQLLDKHPYYWPIQNGKKIDIRTRKITTRTTYDYFSSELNHVYLPNLQMKDNVFTQFVRTLFPEDTEYKFIQYLFGYLLSLDITENIFVIFCHPKGGGGKTILMNIIHQVFVNYVTKLSRDTILHGGGNIHAELSKLRNKRIAYIDEALDNKSTQKNIKKKTLVLDVILDITGGGLRQDRDTFEKGGEVKMYKLNTKLVLLGNDNSMNNTTHFALNRRIVYIPMQYYFRVKTHIDYNENDEFCKEADSTIGPTLQNNLNHAFTWLIDCMNLYFHDKPKILEQIPDRFVKEWNNTENSNPKDAYWRRFVQDYIIQSTNSTERLSDVRDAINDFIQDAPICNYTNNCIKQQLEKEPKMKLIHNFNNTRGLYIQNCKLKYNIKNKATYIEINTTTDASRYKQLVNTKINIKK